MYFSIIKQWKIVSIEICQMAWFGDHGHKCHFLQVFGQFHWTFGSFLQSFLVFLHFFLVILSLQDLFPLSEEPLLQSLHVTGHSFLTFFKLHCFFLLLQSLHFFLGHFSVHFGPKYKEISLNNCLHCIKIKEIWHCYIISNQCLLSLPLPESSPWFPLPEPSHLPQVFSHFFQTFCFEHLPFFFFFSQNFRLPKSWHLFSLWRMK